ncbi:hypothetical protein LX36DRAFT_675462 [Colletotrichum falcatum]|nr:hypothetical protein LX36DRAFT_675462 [Colletotrichum falcatum]
MPPCDMEKQYLNCFSVRVESRSQARVPATRNTHTKVRTGCNTCKQRRVKCDEARPVCVRCLKLKAPCGYDRINPRAQPAAANRALLPAANVPSPTPNPGISPFRSDSEKAHFETWHSTTHDFGLDDVFDIFSVTATQLAFQNGTLREIILALGGLKFALGQHASLLPNEQVKLDPHYQTALLRYGRSLRAVSAMAVTGGTMSTILRCCILFFCFDLLDGRHQSVHIHIKHGVKILQQFLGSKTSGADLDLCVASPAPYVVEDSMIQLFQKCSSVSYVHLAPERPLRKCEMRPRSSSSEAERPPALESILPRSFDNVGEAVRWMDLIQHATFVRLFTSASREQPREEGDGPVSDRKRRKEQLVFLEILNGWASAFLPLSRIEDCPSGDAAKKTMLMTSLKIQWINTHIFVYTSHYDDYQALREMESRFRDMVDLARTIVDSPGQARRATPLSISGVVLPLFVVANKCRDAGIRASAEEVLRRVDHRVDGLWDSRAALALVRWARKTEDAYASQLTDPREVWDLVRNRYIVFSDRQNQATVGSQQFQDGSNPVMYATSRFSNGHTAIEAQQTDDEDDNALVSGAWSTQNSSLSYSRCRVELDSSLLYVQCTSSSS